MGKNNVNSMELNSISCGLKCAKIVFSVGMAKLLRDLCIVDGLNIMKRGFPMLESLVSYCVAILWQL